MFGCELGASNEEDINLVFRDPKEYPDAILVNVRTGVALNVEFEENSSNFRAHKHNPKKCDLIVCADHDWKEKFPDEKCPLPVYVIGGNFFPKEE